MKKIFVLLFGLAAAGQVFAQAVTNQVVCAGPASAGNGTLVPGGTSFVRTDILPKCSANVFMNYSQTDNGVAVAANSRKGKYIFTGNTGGGAVGPNGGVCAGSVCTAAQLATPLATALAAAT